MLLGLLWGEGEGDVSKPSSTCKGKLSKTAKSTREAEAIIIYYKAKGLSARKSWCSCRPNLRFNNMQTGNNTYNNSVVYFITQY